jgi:hypothetical protein
MITKPEKISWKHKYDLEKTTVDMLENLSKSEEN